MGLIDDLLDVQVPKGVKISPDGRQAIYTTSTIGRPKHVDRVVSTIWLAQIGQERSARPITTGKYNDADPKWSPDGQYIAFVSDREKPAGSSAIYIVPMKVGEPYALTDPGNERAIEDFEWSPDGQFIAYISADEKTSERKQREKDKDDANVWGQDLVLSRLRIVHVATGQITTLETGHGHVDGFSWSPDGTRIALVQTRKTGIEAKILFGSSISVIEVASGKIRSVGHFASSISKPTWAGNTLFFIGNVVPIHLSSAEALWSMDLISNNPEFRRRAHGDVDCVGSFVVEDQGIVVSSKQGTSGRIHVLDRTESRTYSGEISSFDAKLTPDKTELILVTVASSVGVPFEVYAEILGGEPVQLSSHGDILKGYEFGTASVLECQSADGEVGLDAMYFSPAKPKGMNRPNGPFPTAVICHGGPYGRSTDSFNPHPTCWLPLYLEAGYGVLMPNYRGGSGRGDKFAGYARGDIGGADYEDVISLTQCAIEKGYADKDHLLIGGWSHGGSMAYMASVRNGRHGFGWNFKAVIAGAGCSDPDTMRFTSDMGLTFEVGLPGIAPWDSHIDTLEARRRESTVWSFKEAAERGGIPPILILHCEQDKRVPFEQAVGVRRALQFYGLPFEFVSYPREPHRMMEYMHLKDRMERSLRWAETYISPN